MDSFVFLAIQTTVYIQYIYSIIISAVFYIISIRRVTQYFIPPVGMVG